MRARTGFYIFYSFLVINFSLVNLFGHRDDGKSCFLEKHEVMSQESKIYVAGHRGLVGSALMRQLRSNGYNNIVTRTSKELDLRDTLAVRNFFEYERPDFVFLAAAKVGGIKANNDFPADFGYENLMIEANVLHAAYEFGVKKLLFLGSSCIYPRDCPQPIKEEYLMTGVLEKTNEAYAIAKIAGITLCQSYNRQYGTNFISCMPTNLYGPEDNFDLQSSHVLPALISKIYAAHEKGLPTVEIWGDGTPKREFLYVDDLADAVIFLMKNYTGDLHINVGTGQDTSIFEVASLIKDVVGYTGDLVFDTAMPNGTPRKLLDVSRLHNLGWEHSMSLRQGIDKTVAWYKTNVLKDY